MNIEELAKEELTKLVRLVAERCAVIAEDSTAGWSDVLIHEGSKMASDAIKREFGLG